MKLPIIFISTAFLLSIFSLQAAIYHWVDKDGKTHYSDTAVPGTQEITVDNKNLVSADVLKVEEKNNSVTSSLNKEKAIEYKAEITSPQDDMAMRNNAGTLEVHVAITPEKESTHRLQLILDGTPLGEAQISPTIRALNIDRGTHQVQVHLVDENGKVLTKTQIVTVHLQRVANG